MAHYYDLEPCDRIGSSLGFFDPPRQAFRIRFVPDLKSDLELVCNSEAPGKWTGCRIASLR